MTFDEEYHHPEGPGPEDDDLMDPEAPGFTCQRCGWEMYDDNSMCPQCGLWPEKVGTADTPWIVMVSAITVLAVILLIIWGLTK